MATTPGLNYLSPQPVVPRPPVTVDWREWKIFAIAMAGVLLIFGLLHNKWWVPGGDTDLYLVAARNLALGKGYRFNGLPLNVSPPGWPLLLAGAMKISTSFGFLKMVNLTLMTLFLGVFYWIIRRFVPSPWIAAAIIVGTALISHAYELTFWFHSDALFSLLTALSFLIALQIREKQGGNFRAAILILLCIAAVCVRWAGVFNWCIIAGILLSGETRPHLTRPWILAGATFVAFAATFLALRLAMRITPEEMRAIKESGIFVDESLRSETQGYSFDTNLTRKLGPIGEAEQRLVSAGRWFSTLFWQPFRIGAGNHVIDGTGVVIGWFGNLLLAVTVVRAWRKRQWMWVGLGVSCAVLFALWPNVTGRYLVPWTPLLLIALLEPLLMYARREEAKRRIALGLFYTFIISATLCNTALFSIEAWVARQHNFYAAYDAGFDQSIINIAHYLIDRGVADNQIAISPKYVNIKPRFTRWGIRATLALTDRTMYLAPRNVVGDVAKPPDQPLMNWAHQYHVKYYICLPPISPWRVWHFRVGWLQKKITKKPVVPSRSGWQLWDVSGPTPVEITVPPIRGWPTHVPDL